MQPCKCCGALSDGEIGLCPGCIRELENSAIRTNPAISEWLRNSVATSHCTMPWYVEEIQKAAGYFKVES
jgi:hypothetical protein